MHRYGRRAVLLIFPLEDRKLLADQVTVFRPLTASRKLLVSDLDRRSFTRKPGAAREECACKVIQTLKAFHFARIGLVAGFFAFDLGGTRCGNSESRMR